MVWAARECSKLNKNIAHKIAEKTKESYSQVMGHIRTRLRFALLKATLVATRGYRGRCATSSQESEEDDIDFNLIPEEVAYETL